MVDAGGYGGGGGVGAGGDGGGDNAGGVQMTTLPSQAHKQAINIFFRIRCARMNDVSVLSRGLKQILAQPRVFCLLPEGRDFAGLQQFRLL